MEAPKGAAATVNAAVAPAMYPPGPAPAMGPVVYHQAPPPPMTIGQVLSPAELKKIRKMTWINFGLTMFQLACCVAFIVVVSNELESTVWWGTTSVSYQCLIGTNNNPSPCRYAYTLASVSIFWGFVLSLIQCLTLDCCGMGRFFELMFDVFAAIWWIAGAITLGTYVQDADAAGVPKSAARHAILALASICGAMFICLAVTNIILIKKYGKALKSVKQQMATQAAAQPAGYWVPAGGHAVQMGAQGQQQGVYAPAGYPGAYPAAPAPTGGVPPGYPGAYQAAPAPMAGGVPQGYPAAAAVPHQTYDAPAGYPAAPQAAPSPAAAPAAAPAPGGVPYGPGASA